MGSPLGSVFTEIFLNLANCPSRFKLTYYRRYVDDCFLLFRSPHTTQFLNYLNSQHPNINISLETENNKTYSFIPFEYKKGLVMTLLHCYFSNCSCFASFTSQLVSFKKTFLLNIYPISFVDNCIQSFLNKIHSPASKVSLAPRKILYFCLPFTGQHTCKFAPTYVNSVPVHFYI